MNYKNKIIITLFAVIISIALISGFIFFKLKGKLNSGIENNSIKTEKQIIAPKLEAVKSLEQEFISGKIKQVSKEENYIIIDANGNDEKCMLSTSTEIKIEIEKSSAEYEKKFKEYSEKMALAYQKIKNGGQLTEEESKSLIAPMPEYVVIKANLDNLVIGRRVSVLQIADKNSVANQKGEVVSITMLRLGAPIFGK